MKWSEVATRVNGISTPFFGVSWEPATSDVRVVRGLIHFAQGRRMLQEERHCTGWTDQPGVGRMLTSVSEMRTFVTGLLVEGGISAELVESLQIIQRACMDCLDSLDRCNDYFSRFSVHATFDPQEAESNQESLGASLTLYRRVVDKVLHQVAQAHGLTYNAR